MTKEETLAERVKRLRTGKGFSQQELATQAGLAISLITGIEQGRKRNPYMSTIVSLARALGISADELATGIPPADVPPRKQK